MANRRLTELEIIDIKREFRSWQRAYKSEEATQKLAQLIDTQLSELELNDKTRDFSSVLIEVILHFLEDALRSPDTYQVAAYLINLGQTALRGLQQTSSTTNIPDRLQQFTNKADEKLQTARRKLEREQSPTPQTLLKIEFKGKVEAIVRAEFSQPEIQAIISLHEIREQVDSQLQQWTGWANDFYTRATIPWGLELQWRADAINRLKVTLEHVQQWIAYVESENKTAVTPAIYELQTGIKKFLQHLEQE